jgi:putative transposase
LERNKKGFTLADIKAILDAKKIVRDPLVKIYTDCLMPNHYHFFLEEIKDGGISLFMKKLGISYAKYFTTKYNRPGSLFQGRFKSVQIKTDEQMMYLLAYINIINPAQLVEPELKEKGIKNFNKAWNFSDNYNWSTHQEFTGRRESILIDENSVLKEMFSTAEIYTEFVKGMLKGKEQKIWPVIDGFSLE